MMILLNSLFVLVTILFASVGSEEVGGLCFNNGESEVLLNNCSRYLECENGGFIVKKCGQGKIFDSVNKGCVTSSLSKSVCARHCTFNDKKPVKGSQNEYVYCESGLLKVGSCQGHFNRFSKKCERNYENNLKYNHDHNKQWVLISQEKCEPGNKIPIGNSCTKYMECDSNKAWVPAVCPDCQHFQPESMECVWAWKYYCGSSVTTDNPTSSSTEEPSSEPTSPTEEPTTGTTPTEEPTSETTQTEGPITPTEEPTTGTTPTEEPTTGTTPTEEPTTETTLTEDPVTPTEEPTEGPVTPTEPTSITTTLPTTPIPPCSSGTKKAFQKGDCKDYLECDSGKWVKKSCSFGYDFDINKLDCVWSWWAKC